MPFEQPPAPVEMSRVSLLALALWAGTVTGLAEVAVIVGPLFGVEFAHRSRDAVWMIPALDGALFVGLGFLLVLVGVVIEIPWSIAAGLFAGSGAILVLLLFPRLHPLAAVVVAIAVGVQVARMLRNRTSTAARGVIRTLPWLVGCVCLLAVVTLGWKVVQERRRVEGRAAAATPGSPNVLLLILDTVRAPDLSLYGYARRTSPELDRFAERGTVFDLAFAPASWTSPSHASMFTGRWTTELDVTGDHSLGSRWPTLAEVLHQRGYATAAFVANQVYAGWESGILRGFEHREDYPVSLWTAMASTAFGIELYPAVRRTIRPMLNRLPLLWRLQPPPPGQRPSAEDITSGFLHWLDHTRPTPFFAFLNFMDAHLPYAPPDSFRQRYHSPLARPVSDLAFRDPPLVRLTPADLRTKQDAYDGSIAYLDSELGILFQELERRGLLDSTLIIVVGDHGDEFAEHGLADHGNSLYRLSLHVPLVIAFPGHVPAGRRIAAAVTTRNLAATVLDLLGDSHGTLPGRSLARFWAGADAAPDTIIAGIRQTANLPSWFPVSRGDLNSIGFGGLRYIRNEGDGTEELYDFEHDILERWNLMNSDSGPRLAARYRAALAAVTSGRTSLIARGAP